MHLTDEQILEMLIDYVGDSRYKQAVLIDGEWGSGKTHFVKETLLNRLDKELSVLYVSLYGLNSFEQIMNEIYTSALEDFLSKKYGEEKGKKLSKGVNLTAKFITAGLKYFNIDPNDLPSISDIKQIKDAILIFDDLERCNIDINQLFGFINNLVEHNSIKVIIVANQSEIGRARISNDLPNKYLIAMDSRIQFDEDKNKKKEPAQSAQESISKEQLLTRTNKLFSEDILYKKICEKLIGLTINYQANLDDIYEIVIDENLKLTKAKSELKSKKDLVLNIFNTKQHYNIRTFIFGIIAFEKFFEILDKIPFDPPTYLEDEKAKILKYTMSLSIQIKSGNPTYSWAKSDAQSGVVYLGKSVFDDSIFGYKFVDDFLLHRYLCSDEIIKIITSIMEEKRYADESQKAEDALAFNKLHPWWESEDEQIFELFTQIKKELEEQKYRPRYFKDIIITLIQLKANGFNEIEYVDFIPFMKQKLEHNDVEFKKEYLEILSDDANLVQDYNKLAQPLFEAIDKKDNSKISCADLLLWDDNYQTVCEKCRSYYINGYKFFYYLDPDKVINKLNSSNTKEISIFLKGITTIYNFANLNDFFKADASNIRSLIEIMNIEELSHDKITRKLVLTRIKTKLQAALELIEK